MKKLLKILFPSIFATTALVPSVLTTTSCSENLVNVTIKNMTLDYVLGDSNPGKMFTMSPTFTGSYRTLINGARNINEGDYIIFVGSDTYSGTLKFFSEGQDRLWLNEQFIYSTFYNGCSQAVEINPSVDENLQFFMMMDELPPVKEDQFPLVSLDSDKVHDNIVPFRIWSETIIEKTTSFYFKNRTTAEYNRWMEWKDKNLYEKDGETLKSNNYVRQDFSAKQFRSFVDYGARIYEFTEISGNFNNTADNSSNYMCYYKDGILQGIIPIEDTYSAANFATFLSDTYKTDTEE